MRIRGGARDPGRPRPYAAAALGGAVLATLVLAVVAATAGGAAGAAPGPAHTVTVTLAGTGDPAVDRTFRLSCRPPGGDLPAAPAACARLDELARAGWSDAFDPVPPGSMCTEIYGGPATARVTGTWGDRAVDARLSRIDGCEIARWEALGPVLPAVGAG